VRGLFVTGTDTGVGKTILSAALLATMRSADEPITAHKPVITGLDEQPGEWPPDHELLAAAAGMNPEEVAPLRYGPAVSPHLAATLAHESIDPTVLVANARRASAEKTTLIVEGVGGLLTPLTDNYSVRDLAAALELPLLIAARPGLGTINHTLLTIEAARTANLKVAAVVLTPWPADPSEMERSNRATIAHLGQVEVATLDRVEDSNPSRLLDAGGHLPWRRWLGESSQA
jgi:dethiobiotin synthetase